MKGEFLNQGGVRLFNSLLLLPYVQPTKTIQNGLFTCESWHQRIVA